MPLGQPLRIPLPKTTWLDNPLDGDDLRGLLSQDGLIASNALMRNGMLITRPGLTLLGQVLNEPVTCAFGMRSTGEILQIVVGTPTRWWLFNNGTKLWTDLSGGVLLTGVATMPISFSPFAQGGTLYLLGCNDKDATKEWALGGAAYAPLANAPIARKMTTVTNRVVTARTQEAGTTFPFRVRWSSAGDRTAWPANAFVDLLDGGDLVVSLLPLGRRSMAIYKEQSQWLGIAQQGSDANAFEFVYLDGQPGPLGPAAVAVGPGGLVHVYGGIDGNLYQFDGTSVTMLAKTQRWIQSRLNFSIRSASSIAYYQQHREIWWAVPLDGEPAPKHILVFNYETGGFHLQEYGAATPVNCFLNYSGEFETVTNALPDVPTDQLPDVPTNQLGLSSSGMFLLAGSSTGVFSLDTTTDNLAAIPNDWRVLLPIVDDSEWEFDGVDAHFLNNVPVPIQVSALAGPTLDALTETVIGTLTPSLNTTRVMTTTETKVRGRVLIIRFLFSGVYALQLRRLLAYAWPRKIAV